MTIKHWDDQELAKVSADLDAELEQLFDEMETVLTSPSEDRNKAEKGVGASFPARPGRRDITAAASAPGPERGLEFLPDEEEAEPPKARRLHAGGEVSVPARSDEPQDDDFEDRAGSIAPADDLDEAERPAVQPKRTKQFKEQHPEQELPEAEVLPDDYAEPHHPRPRPTIADLSPDDFSRLMERAVARGVLAALKKWQRPLR